MIFALDDLLDIIDVINEMNYECIIGSTEIMNTYILEVYDDWRE